MAGLHAEAWPSDGWSMLIHPLQHASWRDRFPSRIHSGVRRGPAERDRERLTAAATISYCTTIREGSERGRHDLPTIVRQRLEHLQLRSRQPTWRRGAHHRSRPGEGRPLPQADGGTRPEAGQGGRHPSARRPHHRPRRAARPHALRDRDGRPEQGRRGVDADRRRRPADCRGLEPRCSLHPRPHRRFLQLLFRRPGVHRRHAPDPRHRPHRLPERRLARAMGEPAARLLRLPEETLVFPAHDYKGDTVSTIGEEKRCNPRLKVANADEYAELMAGLNLPNPKMMDVAVPANIHQGLHQEEVARRGWAFSADEAKALVGQPDVALIDLREKSERERSGAIPGSLHAPYAELMDNIDAGGLIHELARSGKKIVFFCAFGERSAMAVQAAQDKQLSSARHIEGGMAAWKKAGGATR